MDDNEENQIKAGLPEIDFGICTGCGDCVAWCPGGAVKLINGKPVMVWPEKCDYCAECEAICPARAIKCPFDIILVNNPEPKK